MVREVHVAGEVAVHMSGAKVAEITAAIPDHLATRTHVATVIVHVGSNDIDGGYTEELKDNFRALITAVHTADKTCIISGPFPSPCFSHTKFSRIWSLHLWLKGRCLEKIPYAAIIDVT